MKKISNIFLLFCLIFSCSQYGNGKTYQDKQTDQDIYTSKRYRMVEQQIERRGIRDSLVLKAMRNVPRHRYVPEGLKNIAYSDRPLPIGERQTISQPYIVAFMTEHLGLKGGEKVLEIGTGSGYQAAILGEIANKVYSIEIISSLGLDAKKLLKTQGYNNIHVRIGDGYAGWPEKAPFDAVIVTAAPGHIPQPLIDQLKPGGKMIIPVGDYYQELILITKSKKGKVTKKSVLPVTFVPMTGKAQKK
jgi:protein-L-isoaspartate(D-aspartate) O-methyltransferase